jgi:hypothetical protein
MSWFHHLFLPHHSNNHKAKLLHSSGLSFLILFFIAVQLGISQITVHYPLILGYASQISPDEIIRLTNAERQKSGLTAVKLDPQLTAAAVQKAADMFAKNYWAHVSPSGTQPWYFITNSGYSYRYAGENLARDFSDPASVVSAWMNSPSHRDNLLNAHYQDIGIAVVDGQLEGRDTTLVVQMFGARLAAAPSVGGTSSFAVKAQEDTPAPSPQVTTVPTIAPEVVVSAGKSVASPYSLTRWLSLGVLGLLALILAVDIIVVRRRHLTRWTSRSFAHFIFVGILIIAAITILRGQII